MSGPGHVTLDGTVHVPWESELLYDAGPDLGRRADANDIQLFIRQHLFVITVEMVGGQTPSLTEDPTLLVVQIRSR